MTTVPPLHHYLKDAPRIPAKCAVFGVCGGCRHQDIPPEVQIAAKERRLLDLFRERGLSPARRLPALLGPPFGYRHRARLSARHVPRKGGVLVGFRERKKSYVTDTRECPILPESASRLLGPLRELLASLSIPSRIPQVDVVWSDTVRGLLLRHLEPLGERDRERLAAFEEEHGVYFYLQSGGLGTVRPLSAGTPEAPASELPEESLRLAFLPWHFTQVNPVVNRQLVARCRKLLAPGEKGELFDLFCGVGNFALALAKAGWRVRGYEAEESQVRLAERNARDNGLSDRACFTVADLYDPETCMGLPWEEAGAAVFDPPRTGAEVLAASLPSTGGPLKILYVSCGPEALARDAEILVKGKGYRLEALGAVDMFPHTEHVEATAFFERKP